MVRQAKPNPNGSQSGTLCVGHNVVNDSPFGALSRWRSVYGGIGLQNKNVQKASPY